MHISASAPRGQAISRVGRGRNIDQILGVAIKFGGEIPVPALHGESTSATGLIPSDGNKGVWTFGVCPLWTRVVRAWAAVLLGLSGIAFPVSRIPRIEWLTHLTDALLLIPAVYLGWQVLRQRSPSP